MHSMEQQTLKPLTHAQLQSVKRWFMLSMISCILIIVGIGIDTIRLLPAYLHVRAIKINEKKQLLLVEQMTHQQRTLTQEYRSWLQKKDMQLQVIKKHEEIQLLCKQALHTPASLVCNSLSLDHETISMSGTAQNIPLIQEYLTRLSDLQIIENVRLSSITLNTSSLPYSWVAQGRIH